jgi:putative transposase
LPEYGTNSSYCGTVGGVTLETVKRYVETQKGKEEMGQPCAYQYRFYPTPEQQQILARQFGCVRYVYNWALRLRIETYKAEKRSLSTSQLSRRLTVLKQQREQAFLNDVSSVPLQQSLRHLAEAFTNFFEGRAGYPTFKARHDKQSAEYTKSAFTWDGKVLRLAKMQEPLDIRWSRPLPEGVTPTTVIVSKDRAGRYFVSIRLEQEQARLPVCNKVVGLDLGLKSMVVTSDGEAIGNPKFFARDEKKLARAQRRLCKKKKGSRNRKKARRKVARIHARITDRRRNYQHQLSSRMIRENQTICVESLRVKNMVKNHCLAKSIHDVGWGEFVRLLEYKAAWYGRTLIKIDTFFPSSKRCFDCGHVLDDLPLEVREWTCPKCGVHHDRDLNAANNILAEGLSVAACGEPARPERAQAPSGKPRRSRKALS